PCPALRHNHRGRRTWPRHRRSVPWCVELPTPATLANLQPVKTRGGFFGPSRLLSYGRCRAMPRVTQPLRTRRTSYMSMINKTIGEWKATAFVNGEFKLYSSDDVKGKWAIYFFYPADFTF